MLYLVNTSKSSKSHFWDGTDSYCRMWSTGGIIQASYSLSAEPSTQGVCKLCLSAANRPGTTEIWIYVLELQNGHYYVGQTGDISARLEAHRKGNGSAWTRLHPIKRELMREPTGTADWKVAEIKENQRTLEMMSLHGWQNVRGGYWCNTCEIQTRQSLIAHGQEYMVRLSRSEQPLLASSLEKAPTQQHGPIISYKKRRTFDQA